MRLEHLLSGVVNDEVVNICKDGDEVKDNPKKKNRRQQAVRTKDDKVAYFIQEYLLISFGGLAQLARAPALHAGGQRFESVILHEEKTRWAKPISRKFDTSSDLVFSTIFDILESLIEEADRDFGRDTEVDI